MSVMSEDNPNSFRPNAPTSDEFTRTMGQVVWLLTLSKEHRSKPISLIEAHVTAPLMFKQVRVYTKGKQPLAAVVWAYASNEVRKKIEKGGYEMALQDWRSGPDVVVVDCISPLMDQNMFIDQFLAEVENAQAKKV